jgi:hypothetical protein
MSGAFLWVTVRGLDLREVGYQLERIEVGPLLGGLMSLGIIFMYKAFRWQYQMSTVKRITLGRSLSAIMIGYMANSAVPLRGGDLLRAHVLGRRENLGTATVCATVAVERILDVVSLVTVTLVMIGVIPVPSWMRKAAIALGSGLALCGVGIIAVRRFRRYVKNWCERGLRWFPRNLEEVLQVFITEVRRGLETAKGRLRLANLYVLAAGEWGLWVFLTDYSLQAVGIQLSLGAIIVTVVATNLAVMLPAAPGYIGVFDYAVMMTLVFYGLDKSLALSGAIVLHAIFVIPASVVGLVLFLREWLIRKEGVV